MQSQSRRTVTKDDILLIVFPSFDSFIFASSFFFRFFLFAFCILFVVVAVQNN